MHNNHFCVIWISNGINFSKAVEELELNFKYVNNKVTDANVNKFKEYKFNPKKVDSQLNNVIVYDIETYNKERAIPYAIGFYPVSKIVSKWNRDLTQKEIDKCLNDVTIFKGEKCVSNMFDYLKLFTGEPKYVINNCGKSVLSSYELKMIAHNGSGFDAWIILYNLPDWCSIASMIKTGKGIINLKILNGFVGGKNGSKGKPQYITFVCSMNHLSSSLKKLGETFGLQKELLKQEMNHTEIYEDTWWDKMNEWLPYLKMDVLSLAFIYARYSMNMDSITGFGMKNCLSLPSLGWKYYNCMRTEENEPIYSYTDKYMRHFVRQSIKGGKVGAFNQYFESTISDKIFKTIMEELNVQETKYEIIEKYAEYIKDIKLQYEKEYDSQFDDYRKINIKEKDKYINKKLSQLPISMKMKEFNRDDLLMAFDATSLYPSAMYDEKSIYPKIETGYAFTEDMNDELVKEFNNQTFNKSAILKIKYYNPPDIILQHLPVKEEVNAGPQGHAGCTNKIEVNRLRNGYIIRYTNICRYSRNC